MSTLLFYADEKYVSQLGLYTSKPSMGMKKYHEQMSKSEIMTSGLHQPTTKMLFKKAS